tara:strand:+ start:2611 stop:3300 length:690 start_codon:yes stop_codon:yes gene_type:complete
MKVKNKKTYYQIILDKSGSMQNCINSTVNGFNEQMQMIKSLQNKFPDQKVLVSLTTFNQDVDFDVECSRPFELKEMTSEQTKSSWLKKSTNYLVYSPNGMTALYDAIGKSVKKIQQIAKEEIENNEATVVVVIITDGHENASIEFEFNQIQSMINELEKSENWTFSYLSSTLDAVDYATKMNIKQENSFRYNKAEMTGAHSDLAFSLDSYIDKKNKNIKDQQFYKFKRK